MKNLLNWLFIFTFSIQSFAQDTFSIVAVDESNNEIGSAGASCINGSIIISDIIPNVGAIHTQASYISPNQDYAHQLMLNGHSPQEIIDSLAANDAQGDSSVRQYGIVDLNGGSPRTAALTGYGCFDFKFHRTGPNYSIQGNILIDSAIIDSIEAGFLNSTGALADRLMAALQGANSPGADSRCLSQGKSSLSSFIRVAKATDTDCIYLHLNVNSTPAGVEPIDSLQNLYNSLTGDCEALKADLYQNRDTTDMILLDGRVTFAAIQGNVSCVNWDLGDETIVDNSTPGLDPVAFTHYYDTTGTYEVRLIISNMNCSDTAYSTIVVLNDLFNPNGIRVKSSEEVFTIYPNPANDLVNIKLNKSHSISLIEIVTLDGKVINRIDTKNKNQLNYKWDSTYRKGTFLIRMYGEEDVYSQKITVN